jgi:hypothetical protein
MCISLALYRQVSLSTHNGTCYCFREEVAGMPTDVVLSRVVCRVCPTLCHCAQSISCIWPQISFDIHSSPDVFRHRSLFLVLLSVEVRLPARNSWRSNIIPSIYSYILAWCISIHRRVTIAAVMTIYIRIMRSILYVTFELRLPLSA